MAYAHHGSESAEMPPAMSIFAIGFSIIRLLGNNAISGLSTLASTEFNQSFEPSAHADFETLTGLVAQFTYCAHDPTGSIVLPSKNLDWLGAFPTDIDLQELQ